MEYNTARDKMVMPEYGRHIQKMINYLHTIEDKDSRQKNANAIIELMGMLNPHLRIVEDFRHMLWDHLFFIAGDDLGIESPYPKPTIDRLNYHPDSLPYPKKYRGKRHLGRNINTIIEKALAETDEEKRKGYAHTIAYYMKLSYVNWHQEPVPDEMIKEELKSITQGKLSYDGGDIKVRVDNRQNANRRRNGKNHSKNNNHQHNKNHRKPKRNNNR